MEYSLDYMLAADSTGLLPILDMKAPSNLTKQVTLLPFQPHQTNSDPNLSRL